MDLNTDAAIFGILAGVAVLLTFVGAILSALRKADRRQQRIDDMLFGDPDTGRQSLAAYQDKMLAWQQQQANQLADIAERAYRIEKEMWPNQGTSLRDAVAVIDDNQRAIAANLDVVLPEWKKVSERKPKSEH